MDRARPEPAWTVAMPMVAAPSAWLLPAAAVALAAFLIVTFGPSLFDCGDTSWHLAAGDWIIAHRTVPQVDPFSLTFAGRPWVAHEWLAEVAMAAAFAIGSWSGLALLFAGIVAATLLVIGQAVGWHLAPAKVLGLLALIVAVLIPTMLARPHVVGWLMLAIWLGLLLRMREAGRVPPAAAALLIPLWANLHASFLFGLALAAALAIEALLERPRAEVLRGWATFGLLAAGLALLTPHGIEGFLFPIKLSAMRTLPLIDEWQATDFAAQPAFALLIGAGLYLIVKHRVRVPIMRAAIVVATLLLALIHARHQAIFAIVAPMVLAAPIGRAIAASRPPARLAWPVIGLLGAGAVFAVILRLAVPAVEKDGATNPVAMLDAVPADLLHRPVLNGYAFGGPLIRRGIAPFIDGRADMYGDDFVEEYARLDSGDMAAFRAAAARYGLAWTILPPNTRLVAALDREPGWRRWRADKWAVIHVRARR